MSYWQLAQGSSNSWTVPAVDENGTAIPYTGLEGLSARIWPGGQQAVLATLTPVWKDAVNGLTLLTIPASVTAALSPQVYRIECTLTDAGGAHDYYRGSLEILADPGVVVAPPTYCGLDDLRDYAAWIDDLMAETDQAGFARQCGRARTWLDDMIIDRFKFNSFSPTIGQPGFGAWAMFGPQQMPPSKWLRDQLDANLLMIRGKTLEITAKRALYYICRPQIGGGGNRDYQTLAKSFLIEAENMVKTYVAEIDLDGDGYPDITVRLGSTNLR